MKKGKQIDSVLRLFAVFFKIGLVTFGGGYAMISVIEDEIAVKRKYIQRDELLDIIAVSQSTPGPIAVNAATFVGYRVCGVLGSAMATLGVVLPAFLITLILAAVYSKFSTIPIVVYAFNGVRAGVLALIVKACWSMYGLCPKTAVTYTVLFLSFILVLFFPQGTLYIIAASALVGIFCTLIGIKGEKKK